jgi:hypothetical protein
MTTFLTPEHKAEVHLYDVGDAPKVNRPLVFHALYGRMRLSIHIHPSFEIISPPSVMRSSDYVLLQSPIPGESVLLKVQLMPWTGNILVDEITDPESLVLEARSGRWYPRNQVENQEFLRNRRLQELADAQAQGDPTQAEGLHSARVMGEMTAEMFPPQRPAVVMSGFESFDAADKAQRLGPQMQSPTPSASVQPVRSNANRPGPGKGKGKRSASRVKDPSVQAKPAKKAEEVEKDEAMEKFLADDPELKELKLRLKEASAKLKRGRTRVIKDYMNRSPSPGPEDPAESRSRSRTPDKSPKRRKSAESGADMTMDEAMNI